MFDEFSLTLLALLLGIPVAVAGFSSWRRRRREAVPSGWGGVIFIGLSWLLALVVIVAKIRP